MSCTFFIFDKRAQDFNYSILWVKSSLGKITERVDDKKYNLGLQY